MKTVPNLPPSLWTATAQPAPATQQLHESLRTDVAIVGAGFCGLRCSIELAEAGVSTCVIDAGDIGWGASGRNGGQVNPIGHESPSVVAHRWGLDASHDQVERYTRFTTNSADALFALVRQRQIVCDAEQNGWIRGIHADSAQKEFEQLYTGWKNAGAALRLIERQELEQLSGTHCYSKGWVAAGGGSVQPLSYVRGLAQVALAAGVQVFTNTQASKIAKDGARWKLSTPQGVVTADTVVLCTNGYTDGLYPGLRQTIVPVVSSQSATQPLSPAQIAEILPQRHTFADTRRVIYYFRKTADNRLVFGSAGSDPDNPSNSDRKRLIRGLRTVYPQFPDLELEYVWGGRIAVTLDHLPHVHELEPGLITALGCNGRGVAMATAMGAQLSSWVLQRNADSLAVPVTPVGRIPMHRFHRIGVRTAVWWKEHQDQREAKS